MPNDASSLVTQGFVSATPLLSSLSSPLDSVEATTSVDGQPSFNVPTPEQQTATNDLIDIDEDKIFTWLTVVRSIGPGFGYRHVAGGLSSVQLNALFILRDCRDSDISIWLQYLLLAGKRSPLKKSIVSH